MPRARRFGFIAQSSTDARTLAHELGHGAFNLEHTFPVLPQGTTDNLMDYNGGTRLIKPQWDLVHNPELTTGLLDDETDGASKCYGIFDDCEQVLSILSKIRNIRINGNYVVIKKQTDDNFRKFVGYNIDIDKTEFKKIRIIYKPSKTKDIVFDPLNYYEVYKEQIYTPMKMAKGMLKHIVVLYLKIRTILRVSGSLLMMKEMITN